jgi:ABC-type amino acid transport system permease subunit
MNRAIEQTSITFTPMAVYITAGATYLALTLPCARLGRWLERRAVRERAVATS